MANPWTVRERDLVLDIRVVPGSSKNAWCPISNGQLRVKIAAAPEDGKANAALIKFIAQTLGCRKADCVLLSGEKSRSKRIALPLELLPALKAFIAKIDT